MVGGAGWRLGPDAAADELRLNFAFFGSSSLCSFLEKKVDFWATCITWGGTLPPLRCNLVSVCIPHVGTGNECVAHLVSGGSRNGGFWPQPQWGQPGGHYLARPYCLYCSIVVLQYSSILVF